MKSMNFTTGLLRYGSVGSTGPINENRRLLAYSQSSGPKPTKAISMSTEAVRQANLAAITCEPRPQLPDGFRRNSARVGALLGAAGTGLSVYELPPGQAVSPYHYEDPQEEWLLVVSGTPTLRHPDGEDQLEPWDLVFFPAG